MARRRTYARAILSGLGVSTALAACASSRAPSDAAAAASSSSSGAGGGLLDGGAAPAAQASSSSGIDPDAACAAVSQAAVSIPVDLFIAFDKSSSMAGSKWMNAKAGLSAFVNDPMSSGVSAALAFFPLDGSPTCDQKQYEAPVVAFGALPQNGAAIDQAMDAETPDGFTTPIYPALGGAILAVKAVVDASPGTAGAVLLVTDGAPDGPGSICGGVDPDDPQANAMLAAAGLQYGVHTFVIGLPGVDLGFANAVATAGGTGSAILVGASDVQAQFEMALDQVRGQSVPCTYDIPKEVKDGQIDFMHVNVDVTQNGMETTLSQDPSCVGQGWKYDDPANPEHIILCPATCALLHDDFTAKVDVLLGCKTQVLK